MASFVGDLWRKVGELKLNSSTNKLNSSFPFVFDENKSTGHVIGPFKQFEGQEFESPGKEESLFRRVSVFCCKERMRIEEAKRIVKGLKSLKHPRILRYISSKETDAEVILVTEWAEPFQSNDRNTEEWETWGRWSVQQVYEFLRENRKVSLNGDCGNLWITASGEVKVAVFNETCGDFEEFSDVMKRTFPSAKAEKNELINLTESFDYLVTFSSGERVNLIKKLFNFKNPRFLKFLALPELVRTRKLIGNVTGTGQQEVSMEEVQFLFVKGKELLTRDPGDKGSATNDFLFLLSEFYCELLGKHATNTIPMTACLLEQMGNQGLCELFIEKYAQDKIYPHVSVLLGHPMPAMRESAIKALESLCDKLSAKTLGNDVLRQIARLQGDSEGILRLKAVGMLAGPLWSKLPDSLKSKICGPAVARALSDPFTPCRRSGLALLRQGLPLLPANEVVSKVIPAVAMLLIEPDATVRSEAFECMEKMILPSLKRSANKVENVTKSPESVDSNVSKSSVSSAGISSINCSSCISSVSKSITNTNQSSISSLNLSSVPNCSEVKLPVSGKMKLGSIKKIA